MKINALIALSVFVLIGAGCAGSSNSVNQSLTNTSPNISVTPEEQNMKYSFPGILPAERIENKIVTIETVKGNIVFELFTDTAPKTVSNFVYLAEQGYFDGLTFHRFEPGFVIQGGDPDGNGTGGPGYTFEDELNDSYTYEKGIVAMANRGPNTNGSQFFIMLDNVGLPKLYSIFGRVISGIEVVDQIRRDDIMTKVTVSER
jgi:cyclophilin family peptidyl-prolyl cis-trans isomerase